MEKTTLRLLLASLMMLLIDVEVKAELVFGIEASDYDQKEVSKALSYRSDISKDVLKQTKGWISKPIPHSDWLERARGKSIDLQGNVLFPECDYDRLYEWLPNLFIIANTSTHKAGLIHRSGILLVPMIYDDVEETITNPAKVFIGKKKDGTTDIYTQQGLLLCSISNAYYIWAIYHDEARVIEVSYTMSENSEEKYFQFFWTDGTRACEGGKGRSIIVIEDLITLFSAEGMVNIKLNRRTAEQPDLKLEYEILSNDLLQSNMWLALANDYFEAGQYAKAYDCLKYYRMFDNLFSLTIGTSVGPFITQMQMNCLYQTKRYKEIIIGTTGTTAQKVRINFNATLHGLDFDESLECFKFSERIYPKEAIPLIQKCAEACTNIYQSSLPAYHNQVARQQKNAELWGAMFTAMSNSRQQSLAGFIPTKRRTFDNSSTSSTSTTTVSLPVTSSYDSASSSSSSSEPVKKKNCRICKGTGREVHEIDFGSIASGKKKWCGECGKDVYSGHTHRTCTLCHGSGLY